MPWSEVRKRLRRPWGVIIGLVSQFIVMPAVAYALVKIVNLDDVSAVGMIIIATCPGGYVSNLITVLIECDMVLSITMTTISSILAFGLMPLNVFLYTREFTRENDSLKTPFSNLIISLILLIIPILMGMYSHYKLPKVKKVLKILIRPLAVIVIIVSLGFGIPTFLYAFQASPEIYLVGILLPPISSAFGMLLSKIACLDNMSAITVAIETGYQNALVGLALAQLSYSQPEADLITRGPCLYYVVSLIEGSVIVGLYRLMTRYPGKPFDVPDSQSNAEHLRDNNDAAAADVSVTCPTTTDEVAQEEVSNS